MRRTISAAERVALREASAARLHPGAERREFAEVEAVAYVYVDTRGRPSAAFYAGTARGAIWWYSFPNESARDTYIARSVEQRRAAQEAKKAHAAAQKAYVSPITVGTILAASWGYEQTNVNFYEVVRRPSPKFVELREIAQEREDTGNMSGRARPVPGAFLASAKVLRRQVRGIYGQDSVRIGDSRSATVWDGTPLYFSSYH